MYFTLNICFGDRYDYTITARPCSHAVGFLYNGTLELRATCYDSLHAILDFFIQEISDDVCKHIGGHTVPGIKATVSRDDAVLLQTQFLGGNLDRIVKHYMVPMWYTRY